MQMSKAQRAAVDFIDANRSGLTTLSDSIFYFGEIAMQEYRTSELMASLLEEHGFKVERGIAGFKTAFLATYGSGTPVVALHTEYDANPSNSQRSGVAQPEEIVPGAPGHCEGHNCNAAVLVSTAIAIRYAMEKHGLPGTLRIFGAPGEEQLLSRPYFVREGFFDDVDVAFHNHVADRFGTDIGVVQCAAMSADFTFRGEAAHGGGYAWKARDALDAVVLMDAGMAQYREHMLSTMSANRIITQGGEQPNVIPAVAACWWYFRDATAEGARTLYERAVKIAQGAAMMADCEMTTSIRAASWPVRLNRTIAEVIQKSAEAIGMPVWTEDEQRFARALQRQAGVPEAGLREKVEPITTRPMIPAGNDSGDISWKVPMGRLMFPTNVPRTTFHHWTAGAALTTSIAHKGSVAGAKVLAMSAIAFLEDEALAVSAKETFRDEIGDTVYRTLLAPGQTPPPEDTNRALMERFRPEMSKHYLSEAPVFNRV